MKIQRLIFTVFVLVFLLTVCKKYNCECSFDSGSNPVASYGKNGQYIIKSMNKTKAKKKCEEHSTAEDAYGGKSTCEITD